VQISHRRSVFDAASALLEPADQSFERRADLPAHRMVGPAIDPRDPVVRQGGLRGRAPLDARRIALPFVWTNNDPPQDLDVFEGPCQRPRLRQVLAFLGSGMFPWRGTVFSVGFKP